jgi:hypothetical protein
MRCGAQLSAHYQKIWCGVCQPCTTPDFCGLLTAKRNQFNKTPIQMKLPTLSKLPKHKEFGYEPRYYDPEKERMRERRKHLEMIRDRDTSAPDYSSAQVIRGSFKRNARHHKQTDVSQMLFVTGFAASALGFWFYGGHALWAAGILIAGYIWLKIRRNQ